MARRVPPELRVQIVDISELKPLQTNPRRGDVDFIASRLQAEGQYVPIVVRRETGEILKGNHTWHALRQLGRPTVAVLYRDIPDDHAAAAFALADNRASDLGTYDLSELVSTLQSIDEIGDLGPGLTATGYTFDDLDGLLADLDRQQTPPADPEPAERQQPKPRFTVTTTQRTAKGLARHAAFRNVEPAVIIRDALDQYLKDNPLPRSTTKKETT